MIELKEETRSLRRNLKDGETAVGGVGVTFSKTQIVLEIDAFPQHSLTERAGELQPALGTFLREVNAQLAAQGLPQILAE